MSHPTTYRRGVHNYLELVTEMPHCLCTLTNIVRITTSSSFCKREKCFAFEQERKASAVAMLLYETSL
jgi:hypothetical protein